MTRAQIITMLSQILSPSAAANLVAALESLLKITKQSAPTAKTAAATLTAAEIDSKIITLTQSTGATVALTVPTGAQLDAYFTDLNTGEAVDWHVINLSAAAADTGTVTASTGHTVVGNMIVAASHSTTVADSSAHFRTRKTAASTYITYRLA